MQFKKIYKNTNSLKNTDTYGEPSPHPLFASRLFFSNVHICVSNKPISKTKNLMTPPILCNCMKIHKLKIVDRFNNYTCKSI